jgi:FkbM family methyltransferase
MFRYARSLAYKSALWLLRTFNPGDIRIRHHYTRDRFVLDAFKHKGYWYHGKRREAESMQLFADLVGSGNVVIEAGGNIGYMSVYFAKLCGPAGKVIVFEPSPQNLQYLRRNIVNLPQVIVVEKAVGSSSGPRELFIEELTGQNNTFYADYDVFTNNATAAGYDGGGYRSLRVDVITIDEYCEANNVHPDFIKIDIEGAELEALQGSERTIQQDKPRIMVEVSRNIPEVLGWLSSRGYLLFDDARLPVETTTQQLCNVFCLHRECHQPWLTRLGLDIKSN